MASLVPTVPLCRPVQMSRLGRTSQATTFRLSNSGIQLDHIPTEMVEAAGNKRMALLVPSFSVRRLVRESRLCQSSQTSTLRLSSNGIQIAHIPAEMVEAASNKRMALLVQAFSVRRLARKSRSGQSSQASTFRPSSNGTQIGHMPVLRAWDQHNTPA